MPARTEPPAIADAPIPAGNFYNKHESANPVARLLMRGFYAAVEELVETSGARDLHEVGCGEGYLTTRLAAPGRRVRASDVSPAIVETARRRVAEAGLDVPVQARGLLELDPERDAAELVVCCEVLEHLAQPGEAVAHLARLARPWLVASVPREPLWRVLNVARGRYWRHLGNTPGHLQHWSRDAFVRQVERHFHVERVLTPLPWTALLARKKGDVLKKTTNPASEVAERKGRWVSCFL